MHISRHSAKLIVNEIKKILHENINLMDENGTIVASTDPERIGVTHSGALRVIEKGFQELIITEEEEVSDSSVRAGINLPLIVNNRITGVVGITGDPQLVRPYGAIVKRMTEIMIEDIIRRENNLYDDRIFNCFLSEWLELNETTYSHSFIERGKSLGIDVRKKYRILAVNFADHQELSDSLEGQRLLEAMEKIIKKYAHQHEGHLLRQESLQIMILPFFGNTRLGAMAEELSDKLMTEHSQKVYFGLDAALRERRSMAERLNEAKTAVFFSSLNRQEITFYDDLHIELFITDISTESMKRYIGKFFAQIPAENHEEWLRLIREYFYHNGSIAGISNATYMHKNTIQYKLKKLKEYTGKDLRLLKIYTIIWQWYFIIV